MKRPLNMFCSGWCAALAVAFLTRGDFIGFVVGVMFAAINFSVCLSGSHLK